MEMMLDARQKALKINFDPTIYGTFAEIGAGQEVARYFFKAGGASGTIAKTMSAYDMTFSDAIYGKEESGRYVSESRVGKMLTHEFGLLEERLKEDSKAKGMKFFTLANTVTVTNFFGTTEGRGWIGVRFQLSAGGKPNQVVMHVRLTDRTAQSQQDVLGMIGVNLIYACYFGHFDSEHFIESLLENINPQRLEIDLIRFSGPDFAGWDNRVIALELVQRSLTQAVMFNEKGDVILPSERFYKKNVLVVRGSYRPPTKVNVDVLSRGMERFQQDLGEEADIECIAELTTSKLVSADGQKIDHYDFLQRVNLLGTMKQAVLVTKFGQFYSLSDYFLNFRVKKLGIVLGGYNFKQIFEPKYSKGLRGGVFESLALLFRPNVKLYVYPYYDSDTDKTITSTNIQVDENMKHLYQHLVSNNFMVDIEDYDKGLIHIYSRKVLKMIQAGDENWEAMLPVSVADSIKRNGYFGHKS